MNKLSSLLGAAAVIAIAVVFIVVSIYVIVRLVRSRRETVTVGHPE